MIVKTIGRSSENSVVVNDPKVSRHHLQLIQHDDGHYTLSDFGSTNGTYINGSRVSGEVRLNPGDIVRIGDTTLPWSTYFVGQTSATSQSSPQPRVDYTYTPSYHGSQSTPEKDYSVLTFILGLVAFLFVAYIVIKYFTSMSGRIVAEFGGKGDMIRYFPVYLHGTVFSSGQWAWIIISLVLGIAADAVDNLLDTSIDDNKLSSVGKWLANTSVTISGLFLLLAIIAPYLYR